MGVHITVALDHQLKNISMAEVSQRFEGMNDMFIEVAQFWHVGPPLEPWSDAGAYDRGQPFYMGPAGFSFNFGLAAVYIHSSCRFRAFTQDLPTRTLLRRFAHRCCETMGSERAIYAPCEGVGDKIEGFVTPDNLTICDIERELLPLSPPAATFDELDSRWKRPVSRPAYYVDRFDDMFK